MVATEYIIHSQYFCIEWVKQSCTRWGLQFNDMKMLQTKHFSLIEKKQCLQGLSYFVPQIAISWSSAAHFQGKPTHKVRNWPQEPSPLRPVLRSFREIAAKPCVVVHQSIEGSWPCGGQTGENGEGCLSDLWTGGSIGLAKEGGPDSRASIHIELAGQGG